MSGDDEKEGKLSIDSTTPHKPAANYVVERPNIILRRAVNC